jgi:hypothetical protein
MCLIVSQLSFISLPPQCSSWLLVEQGHGMASANCFAVYLEACFMCDRILSQGRGMFMLQIEHLNLSVLLVKTMS